MTDEKKPCTKAPAGWSCTRGEHEDGTPCAAVRLQPSPYGGMPEMSREDLEAELEKIQRRYQKEVIENIALRDEIKKLANPDDDQFRRAIYERGKKDLAEYYESHLGEISAGFDGLFPPEVYDGLPGRWAVAQIGFALRQFFEAAGGINIVSRGFGSKVPYIITIQKKDGKTPEELLIAEKQAHAETTSKLEELKLGLDALNEENRELRSQAIGDANMHDEAHVIRRYIVAYFQSQGRGTVTAQETNARAVERLVELIPELKEIR